MESPLLSPILLCGRYFYQEHYFVNILLSLYVNCVILLSRQPSYGLPNKEDSSHRIVFPFQRLASFVP